MKRAGLAARVLSVVAVLGLVAAACSKSSGGGGTTASANLQKGGTLKVATNEDVFEHWGPQEEYFQESFALFRCCLLRTLMSYNGQDSSHGGNNVYPDLASSNPTVSSDGLTWTFHMKQGLFYAPPLSKVEITSADIVRALMREGDPNVAAGYPFYYDTIQGFTDYSSGKAKTISGLSTPDKFTLAVKLTQPTGDLGFRFAMPATAPIPPNPSDPSAPLGVAQGHDSNYGSFVVASGPYMWAGSQSMNFSGPPSKQKPVSGLQAGKSWTFVRNPSWKDDSLRKAYIDGMDWTISPGATLSVLDKQVANNSLDTVFQNTIPSDILSQYQSSSTLKPLMHIVPTAGNYFITLNLATPPFDDLHVRQAVQYAIDKAAIQRLEGGPLVWPIATHFVPNTLLTTSNGTQVLKNYNPYPTPQFKGDDTSQGLDSAKKAMMQSSKYDPKHDGMCDISACKNVLALGGNLAPEPAFNSQVASNLAKIGITLDLKQLNGSAVYAKEIDPKNHIPIAMTPGWLMDYPDAFTFFFVPIFGPSISAQNNSNYSMIGATPAQLKSFGYSVTSVPSMDSQINNCEAKTGDTRINCWADADKYLTQNIASIVTTTFNNDVNLVSNRVQNYTFSTFDSQTAFDQIALSGGS